MGIGTASEAVVNSRKKAKKMAVAFMFLAPLFLLVEGAFAG